MDRKSPVDTHIGQRLKEYRQHRGMTVRELADAAHVTPGQISRYEHGRDRISHERVTEFARILRIKSNDLYEPPGSRLRRNHVRWRLTNFMAAVIAEAAALMSSRRKAAAAADNFEATMVAAVAVAVAAGASAAAAAGAGEKSSLATSADDTGVDISGSLSGAALKFHPIWHTMAETVPEKEKTIVVESKLEISGAVSETVFSAHAETTLQLDASDAANALVIMDGANTDTINLPGHHTIIAAESQGRGGKVAYDPSMSAAGEQASTQSTSAENGFIVSKPSETASGNKDHSAFQFKPSVDHHAVTDPKINDITKEQSEHPAHPHSDNFKFADNDDYPGKASHEDSKINDIAKEKPEHPAHPHSDNFKFADDDGSAHPGHATAKVKDISVQPSADPKIGDIAKEHPEHPAHPYSDVDQLASFKFADEGSADSGHLAHPHFENAKVPGTVMSGAASDQFVFEKGHDKVADVKPDMIETDHAVADIRHLLHTAHDANAVGALDPNHTTAPQDMTKVQFPYHHGDFHFA
jgi:transcriptional regulator with XRE-family HTH domain